MGLSCRLAHNPAPLAGLRPNPVFVEDVKNRFKPDANLIMVREAALYVVGEGVAVHALGW